MNETEESSYSWLLRTEPTPERWRFELREIVRGNREDFITYFGSASEYVKSLLFNSRNPSISDDIFDVALRRLVDTWQPLASPNTERDLRILQLLGAFTPSEGMGKVLNLLRSLNVLDQFGGNLRVQRLKPVALQVMEKYFPIEQAPVGAFAEYVAQLAVNLANPEYAVYAVARLYELRKLRGSDPRLGVLIESAPQLLPALLALLISGLPPGRKDFYYILALYRHSLRGSTALVALAEFKSAIENMGLHLVEEIMEPYLETKDGSLKRQLRLSDSDLDHYFAKVSYPLLLSQEDVTRQVAHVKEDLKKEEGLPPVSFTLEEEKVSA